MKNFNYLLVAALCICWTSDLAAQGSETKTQEPAKAKTAAKKTKDWNMWGGTIGRNMVSDFKGLSLDFDLQKKTNVKWTAQLGSQTYGNPVVAGNKVWVGTNNGAEYREKHKGDKGILLCFDRESGKFLWQLTRENCRSAALAIGHFKVFVQRRTSKAIVCGLLPTAVN